MIKKFIFSGVCLLPLLSFGQDNILSEIVITENRLEIPFSKTARNIQVITQQDIQKLAAKSINEVLAYIPGVDVRQRGPFGTQMDVGIDGGSFEQTLILLNGVKMSDVQTAHHSMNIPIPLDAVERIEVLKGPAARIYGINALTGAINIVTKSQDTNFFSFHTQGGSSFKGKEEGDGHGIYAGGSLQLVANVGHENFSNLLTVSQDITNGQRYNTAANNRKAFYQANLVADKSNTFNWMLGNIQNKFGANGYYAAPGDKESEELVNTSLVSLGSGHKLGDRLELKPRLSYRHNEDDYRYVKQNLSIGRSEHSTNVYAAELNAILHANIGTFGLGWESRSEKVESTNLGNHHRYNHGAYLEYKTENIKNILLNIGTYINYNTVYGWEVFPGLDVAYLFHPSWRVSFNIGSSERIPSYTDLYLNQTGNVGNADLTPEHAWQYEASIQYKAGNIQLQAGHFRRNVRDFIDWVREESTPPYRPYNFERNRINGYSFSVSQQFDFGDRQSLRYIGSYNFLNPRVQEHSGSLTSKYVLESLKHQALLRLTYQVNDWSFSSGSRYIKRELNKAYFIADVRAMYQFKEFRIYTDLTNALDQSYIETGAVPLPGRWASLGINYVIR